VKRFWWFWLLFATGLLVYFIGGYWGGLTHNVRTVIKCALPAILLLTTLLCRRREHLRSWYRVSLGFLAASAAFLAGWLVSNPLLRLTGLAADTVPGVAMAKLADTLPMVVVAFLVARAGGLTPRELFLSKGNLRAWLVVGLLAFAAFAVLFLLQARDRQIGPDQLLALAPWTLLFIFANAFLEEFHFRGLLLQPVAGLIGPFPANLCIALFFTVGHAPVTYTPDIIPFLAVLFLLALAWGYLIQKTRALWGAVLFHAGADLFIIIGIYETYGSV
jgi:membrane protease YdiL (CAAX protease family)